MQAKAPHSLEKSAPDRRASDQVVALPRAPSDDTHLVARLRAGDPGAFAELFGRFAPRVRGILFRLLGSPVDVDDLVQDTFIAVVRNCASIREPSALASFVHGVALRTGRNELRKRAVRRWLPWTQALEEVHTVPAHDAAVAQAVRRTYAALDKLDADARVAFVLRRVEGCDLDEAAQLCGCSLSTFKRRLSRAERRFEALAHSDPVLRSLLAERNAVG